MVDFRRNLFIDQDDEIFTGPLFVGRDGNPTKKLNDLASIKSEDAITWSVFRMLKRIRPSHWLGEFIKQSTGTPGPGLDPDEVEISFWPHVACPGCRLHWLWEHRDEERVRDSKGARANPERLQLDQFQVLEGETELDALIEHKNFLVVIEAKYRSDLSRDITWDKERDQLGRVIDIAIELALQRGKPSYVVLVTDERQHDKPLQYEALARSYQTDRAFLAARLSHRLPDELDRLAGVGWITWKEVLGCVTTPGINDKDKERLRNLRIYLARRGLV